MLVEAFGASSTVTVLESGFCELVLDTPRSDTLLPLLFTLVEELTEVAPLLLAGVNCGGVRFFVVVFALGGYTSSKCLLQTFAGTPPADDDADDDTDLELLFLSMPVGGTLGATSAGADWAVRLVVLFLSERTLACGRLAVSEIARVVVAAFVAGTLGAFDSASVPSASTETLRAGDRLGAPSSRLQWSLKKATAVAARLITSVAFFGLPSELSLTETRRVEDMELRASSN
mmetsp:Transcript_3070/g.8667  ORF Transcript_3070/g.8667 Transcript_3070/m.8667 type:complete len:231 (+) Transcript_3070:467-1159(+)